jgi:hypothetical protein
VHNKVGSSPAPAGEPERYPASPSGVSMSWVTSKNYVLPDDAEAFSNGLWFNLWTKKLWPYNELEPGDTLYWYESPSKCIVWKSRVVEVLRFSYQTKKEVEQKLSMSPAQVAQHYFVDGPEVGYCLSYKVLAIERVSIPRPDDFKFPRQGWLKVGPEVIAAWPGLSVIFEPPVGEFDHESDSSNKILTGIAGEYFVAGELSRRGYVASLTLRNTRGIDILASNTDATKSVGIQVKANSGKKTQWILSQKAESDIADNLFYVFVNLNGTDAPEYYVVPRAVVVKQVRESHRAWLALPRLDGQAHRDNTIRVFRDPGKDYLNAWHLLGLG